jgi:DNA anti-recombination protein RmuC
MAKNDSQKSIRRKIENINKIFNEFSRKIDSLKKDQLAIVKNILKRVDEEKMNKILKDIR